MVQPSDRFNDLEWGALATRSKSVGAVVASRLERLIDSGELAPGSRLPAERALAARLGVSRGSIREAVHTLWLKGLVDRRQGNGTFITDAGRIGDVFLSQIHDRLSDAELTLVNVLDYRAALEPAIAARAAERARPADIAELARLCDLMADASSVSAAAQLDADFHHAIARATANPLLVHVVEFSRDWFAATRRNAFQSRRRQAQSLASHRRILAAIAAADRDEAGSAMARHIEEVSEFVTKRAGARLRRRAATAKSIPSLDASQAQAPEERR